MFHARTLALSVAALAMTAAACATVPEGAVEDAALACPSGSECYDVPRALGDGGQMLVAATEFEFPDIEGVYWSGNIQVTLDNIGQAEHNIVFEGANQGSEVPQAAGGETATATVNLFEGEYTYYCSIPGHRANGMEGTLTVYPSQDAASEQITESPSGPPATEGGQGSTEGGSTEQATDGATEQGTEA